MMLAIQEMRRKIGVQLGSEPSGLRIMPGGVGLGLTTMRCWYKLEDYGGEASQAGAEETCQQVRAEQTHQEAGVEESQPQAGAEETCQQAGIPENCPSGTL